MELEIISETETSLEVIISGENHTFANLVRSYLEQDPAVLFSAYKVSHPLLDYSKPFMLIKTNGTKSPRKALSDANERLKADVQELQKMI